jgi:hypothetical protein
MISFDIDFSDRRDPKGNLRGTSGSQSYVCTGRPNANRRGGECGDAVAELAFPGRCC